MTGREKISINYPIINNLVFQAQFLQLVDAIISLEKSIERNPRNLKIKQVNKSLKDPRERSY